jgi:transcriptional regulator with PAS, ATPase and Fis domain
MVVGSKSISIDIRIITVTNWNLMEDIAARRLREDLFQRLSIGIPHILPLSGQTV